MSQSASAGIIKLPSDCMWSSIGPTAACCCCRCYCVVGSEEACNLSCVCCTVLTTTSATATAAATAAAEVPNNHHHRSSIDNSIPDPDQMWNPYTSTFSDLSCYFELPSGLPDTELNPIRMGKDEEEEEEEDKKALDQMDLSSGIMVTAVLRDHSYFSTSGPMSTCDGMSRLERKARRSGHGVHLGYVCDAGTSSDPSHQNLVKFKFKILYNTASRETLTPGMKSARCHPDLQQWRPVPPMREVRLTTRRLSAENPETRDLHNSLERQRRIYLKESLHHLKTLIPDLKELKKASKLLVLNESIKFCTALVQQRIRIGRQKKRETSRRDRLLRHLETLINNFRTFPAPTADCTLIPADSTSTTTANQKKKRRRWKRNMKP